MRITFKHLMDEHDSVSALAEFPRRIARPVALSAGLGRRLAAWLSPPARLSGSLEDRWRGSKRCCSGCAGAQAAQRPAVPQPRERRGLDTMPGSCIAADRRRCRSVRFDRSRRARRRRTRSRTSAGASRRADSALHGAHAAVEGQHPEPQEVAGRSARRSGVQSTVEGDGVPGRLDTLAGRDLWDLDGNEWVDVTLGFGLGLFGHRPDFVVRAVAEQLNTGFEIGPSSPLAGEVAALLCEVSGKDRATFCDTGSEAVTAAIRVARTVSRRDKIAVFQGSYHGIFDEVLGRPVGDEWSTGRQHRSRPASPMTRWPTS